MLNDVQRTVYTIYVPTDVLFKSALRSQNFPSGGFGVVKHPQYKNDLRSMRTTVPGSLEGRFRKRVSRLDNLGIKAVRIRTRQIHPAVGFETSGQCHFSFKAKSRQNTLGLIIT